MATYELLKELSRAGIESRLVDIPFILKAHERGVASDSELKEAIPFLAEEFADAWVPESIKNFFRELDLGSGLPNSNFFAHEPDRRTGMRRAHRFALEELYSLALRFPEAADAYRPWLQEIEKSMESARGWDGIDRAEQRLAFFRKSVHREAARQDIFERHFWNGVRVAILQNIAPEQNLWLAEAHRFLNSAGGSNDLSSSAGILALGALKLQLPILSNSISDAILKQGIDFDIVGLGEKTTAEIGRGESTMVIDTPQYASLGVFMGELETNAAGEKLVSLPVAPKLLDDVRWKNLMESPFFTSHPERLIPSNAFWGIKYPEFKPNTQAAFLERHLKRWSTREQHLWAEIEHLKGPTNYAVTIINQSKGKGGFKINAALTLTIAEGEIESARYTIFNMHGKKSLAVDVDERRIRDIVARASIGEAAGLKKRGKKKVGGIAKSGSLKKAGGSDAKILSLQGDAHGVPDSTLRSSPAGSIAATSIGSAGVTIKK